MADKATPVAEAFWKMVYGIILVVVFLTVFSGVGWIYFGGGISKIVANVGETGAGIVTCAAVVATGIIVGFIVLSLKR